MSYCIDNLSALIGSRICHDLISPVGAVTNGLELLELSGMPQSPEMALVSESAAHASAKIRLFRLAFGQSCTDQQVGSEELHSILRAFYAGTRTKIKWRASGNYPRATAQIVMLAVLCTDRAMPFRGRLLIEEAQNIWTLTAASDRLIVDQGLWALLSGHIPADPVAPADVQFAMMPQLLAADGRACRFSSTETSLTISF